MKLENKKVLSKNELLDYIKQNQPKLVVMAGAGDIDVMVKQVETLIALTPKGE
jgi:UDP-N-acetylmuramate--alanine ligase